MKITVITAVYNGVAMIRDAMESVLAQRVDGLEYVVVDGGSSDGTVDVVREFENRSPIVDFKWISESDRGLYDGLNKGIRMASGDVIGICNADDVLSDDNVIARIAAAFEESPSLDAVYGDICFVKRNISGVNGMRMAPVLRYCSGRWFRPWMFRFGTQVAHPSFFCRKGCFERLGDYSLNFGMYGDFELLLRFLWKSRINARYLPICTHVMRLDGASTGSVGKTLEINRSDLRALRDNGYYSNLFFLYSRYLFKICGFMFKKRKSK